MKIADKKNCIEEAAFGLFLEKGYDATSIRMICNKVNIDPPTLYNIFGSKKGLFFSIAEKLLDNSMLNCEAYNNLLKSLPPLMQLYSIFSYSINYTVEHIEESRFFFRYSLFCPEELKAKVNSFIEKSNQTKLQIVNSIIDKCIKKKLIDVTSSEAAEIFWKFVNINNFDVVFTNWRPSNEELFDLWNMFVKCRLKRSFSEG